LEHIIRVTLISRTEPYATKVSFRLSRPFFRRVAFIPLWDGLLSVLSVSTGRTALSARSQLLFWKR